MTMMIMMKRGHTWTTRPAPGVSALTMKTRILRDPGEYNAVKYLSEYIQSVKYDVRFALHLMILLRWSLEWSRRLTLRRLEAESAFISYDNHLALHNPGKCNLLRATTLPIELPSRHPVTTFFSPRLGQTATNHRPHPRVALTWLASFDRTFLIQSTQRAANPLNQRIDPYIL